MEREAYDAILRSSRFVVAVQELDVDILIESAGQAVARTGQNAPPPAALRREGDCRVLGGVAQPKDGERFERPIEDDSTRRDSPTGHVGHAERICH